MRNTRGLISNSCALAFGLTAILIAPEARAETVSLTCALDRAEGPAEASDITTLKIDFNAKTATWNGQTGPITLNAERPDIILFPGWVNARNAVFYQDTGVFGFSVKAADESRWYARSSMCRKS